MDFCALKNIGNPSLEMYYLALKLLSSLTCSTNNNKGSTLAYSIILTPNNIFGA